MRTAVVMKSGGFYRSVSEMAVLEGRASAANLSAKARSGFCVGEELLRHAVEIRVKRISNAIEHADIVAAATELNELSKALKLRGEINRLLEGG